MLNIRIALHKILFVTLAFSSVCFSEQGLPPLPSNVETAPPPPVTSDTPVVEKPTALNPAVKPAQHDDTIPSVYKDMVVVQRKAKKKAGHILFSPYGTIDFSDGPITSYALNTNIGYALSDFWEVYLNVVPGFITIERPIVKKVHDLTLSNGKQADISYAKPLFQYGVEAYWLPAYGKESWGPYSIIRSDTYIKFGAAQVQFAGNKSGTRLNAMIGKTYFLNPLLNVRFAAGVAYAQSVVDDQKNSDWIPVLETGFVYYF